MRLSLKILTAFLLTSLISVALTVGAIRYSAFRDFQEYLLTRELARVEELVPLVVDHFKTENGWRKMAAHPRHWHDLLRAAWHDPATDPPGPPQPRRPGQRPPGRGERPEDGRHPPPGPSGQNGPPPLSPPWDSLHLVPRLTLFDIDRNRLAGAELEPSAASLIPVDLDGRTIAWLGLSRGREFIHPLDRAFMERQTRVFIAIGLAILMLAAGVALVLSRLMTAPIRRLARGARQIADRRFGTRIEIRSRDELGRLAGDFNRMALELGRFQEQQQQWLSDVSHELRTPLSVLIGEIEAIQDGVRPADGQALASLRAEAGHLSTIVNDLHQLSLAEAGGPTYAREELDPLALAGAAVDHFRATLERAGFRVEVDLEAAGPVMVTGDAVRLNQVLTNLLANILNHAAPGRVLVSARRAGHRVIIRVEDSGPGVADDDLPRLFDRLYKADRSRKRSTSGSGLGLAIARAVIVAHNGTIRAERSGAGGLAVEIGLPCGEGKRRSL